MIYIIPKQFNDDWNRIIIFVENLNKLDIKYNSKKNLYPRLKDTHKRGINSSLEIIKTIGSYMISKNNWLEELCYCLKHNFKIEMNNGRKILTTTLPLNDLDKLIFDQHLFCGIEDLETNINNVIQSDNIKDIFINPIEYFKSHLTNISLNETQKLELIKIILN
jgi:hypothetical protein